MASDRPSVLVTRCDRHSADVTIGDLTVAGVPVNTWHEGAGPGLPAFDAVEIAWDRLMKIEGLPVDTIEALADAEEALAEPLQEALAAHLDDRG